MKRQHKILMISSGVAIAMVIGAASGWLMNSDAPVPQTSAPSPIQAPAKPDNTIASAWQWEAFETKEQTKENKPEEEGNKQDWPERNVQYNVALVYDKLQGVRLDSDGNVIKDENALRALQDVFSREDMKELTQGDLAELQELIRIGLPGKAGEQTAQIVGDFHEYLQAREEFEDLYRGQHSAEEMRLQYRELQSLRKLYLGDEVAESLYAERDRQAQFMMESMALARNEQLSEEERQAKQQALSERFHNAAPDINNWDSRYAQYQQQQALIRDAGLAPAEEQRQLRELRSAHFTSDEIASAKERGFLTLPSNDEGEDEGEASQP